MDNTHKRVQAIIEELTKLQKQTEGKIIELFESGLLIPDDLDFDFDETSNIEVNYPVFLSENKDFTVSKEYFIDFTIRIYD